MNGKPVTQKEIERIKKLRKTGHSLPEICRELKRGGSTIHKFAKDIKVLSKYKNILKQKQGGSKERSEYFWKQANSDAVNLLKSIEKRDKLFILASLYWGEGTKKDLNIINSDPILIQVFISCLEELGIKKSDLRISIRIYSNVDIDKAKKYWATVCGVSTTSIIYINVLNGKKTGKLPYGMCRVRITKGGKYFKLIMSMIEFIKLNAIDKKLS